MLLISTADLADRIGDAGLMILDASYHPLDPARDPAAEFAGAHLPGARFLDLATLADAESALPGMRPSAEAVAERLRALGIGPGTTLVLYDDAAHRTAARAWWLLASYGVDDVALLDGGLAKWRAERRAVETGAPAPATDAEPPTLRPDASLVRDLDAMRANLDSHAAIVVDARSPARFAGVEADLRAGVAPGHVPGSYNLPYDELFHADGTWKQGPAMRAAFEDAGVDLDRPLITTCGSGVTAAVLLFGAALIGKRDVALYDGSWSEWGARDDLPRALGT